MMHLSSLPFASDNTTVLGQYVQFMLEAASVFLSASRESEKLRKMLPCE